MQAASVMPRYPVPSTVRRDAPFMIQFLKLASPPQGAAKAA